MLKFEPEMRKTVVWGASVLDTEHSSPDTLAQSGAFLTGDVEMSWSANE
jgi:hypothetical protein